MEIKNFIKKRNNQLMLIILIIGIAILAVSYVLPENKAQTTPKADYVGEEERLSEILSQIEGAGRISVMISYETTAEKELVGESEGRTFTFGGNAVVKREVYPRVRGVIIVADGANNPVVRQELAEAAAAVTGAAANRICVYVRN